MGDYDITKGQLNTNIFLSLSKHDYIMPDFIWRDNINALNNCFVTVHRFEKSGHYPHVEEQELFDKLLLSWIKDKSIQ